MRKNAKLELKKDSKKQMNLKLTLLKHQPREGLM